jgi:hypothetical protein
LVDDDVEAGRALRQLLDKYAPHLRPGRDCRPIQPEELAVTAVYRTDTEEWGGEQKVAPADHPGAFPCGQVPATAPATTAIPN